MTNAKRAALLPVSFFRRPAEVVAHELIGAVMVSEVRGVRTAGRIVEVEAYLGQSDPASHGYQNRRHAQNEGLYGPAGNWYVYLSYGVHWCANLVAGRTPNEGAVLIRALEPAGRAPGHASAPGRGGRPSPRRRARTAHPGPRRHPVARPVAHAGRLGAGLSRGAARASRGHAPDRHHQGRGVAAAVRGERHPLGLAEDMIPASVIARPRNGRSNLTQNETGAPTGAPVSRVKEQRAATCPHAICRG